MFLARRLEQRLGRHQRGQTLVLFVLFLVVLLGVSALTVDYGTWLLSKRGYQNVTDAAALAGVAQLTRPRSDPCTAGKTKATCAREAAWTSVKDQLGLSLDPVAQSASNTPAGPSAAYQEAGYRIWVDTPPTAAGFTYTGKYSSDGTIFVRVERDDPSYFGRIFGQGDPTVSAWSTAGLLSNRYAIIALCPKNDRCPQAEDIKLSGTNTGVQVSDGDVGSNWGLTVTSGKSPGLILPGDSEAYMVDYDKCGKSTWSCGSVLGGIQDGTSAKAALPLPIPVADPAYPLPAIDDPRAVPPRNTNGPITTGVPENKDTADVKCAPDSPSLGPGSYDTIDVNQGGCLILDPTKDLTSGQQPGIFRIRTELTIGEGAFIIGDGVSIFFDATVKKFSVGNGGGIVINHGNAAANEAKGAWTTRGIAPWCLSCDPTYNASADGMGIAFYIRPGSGTTSIFNMSGCAGLVFRGALYGPKDAIGVGGCGKQASAGQIVGYTITYNGTTTLTQTYEGPADERPYLLEPTLGQ
jgi:Flp pilus assembly protein TadG